MVLKQIEANVVILLTNKVDRMVKTIPIWECKLTEGELYERVAHEALEFNEECGAGTVTAQIFDYRVNAG